MTDNESNHDKPSNIILRHPTNGDIAAIEYVADYLFIKTMEGHDVLGGSKEHIQNVSTACIEAAKIHHSMKKAKGMSTT